MWQEFNEESLAHFGIFGMKWGVRRFQNKDGSLTPKGKNRYNDEEPQEKKTASTSVSNDKTAISLIKQNDDIVSKGESVIKKWLQDYGALETSERTDTQAYNDSVAILRRTIGNKRVVDLPQNEKEELYKLEPMILERYDKLIDDYQEKLKHGLFDIWNEDNVVRNALGQFSKKATETVSKAVTTVSTTASNVVSAVGETVKEVTTAADAIFKLAGGLPDWVYAKLFYAVNNGLLTEAEIMSAFNSLGENPSLSKKIAIIDGLLQSREKEVDTDGFNSLEEVPKKEIKPLEEVLNEDHFEYTDWEDPNKRVGNCTLSTFSYELQRRGYDVEAQDYANGKDMSIVSWDGTGSNNPKMMKEIDKVFDEYPSTYNMYKSKPSDAKAFTNATALTNYIRNNPEEYPPKSRGFLEMEGHIQNYEVNSQGKVVWIDGQSGGYKMLGSEELSMQAINSDYLVVMRTDDKEINEDYLIAVRQADDTITALNYMKAQLEREKYDGSSNVTRNEKEYYVSIIEDELKKLK